MIWPRGLMSLEALTSLVFLFVRIVLSRCSSLYVAVTVLKVPSLVRNE